MYDVIFMESGMIPRKIHYCWFGGNPLPEIARSCIDSWRRYCPEYEIVRWDESNCDLNANEFVRSAAENKKWAFVSDYYRLKVVEKYGGVYLDIDVELLKPLDDLLIFNGFMGFELGDDKLVNTGLGFGAIANHPIVVALRENYEKASFIKDDGSLDMTPCPQRDTKVLSSLGLVRNNKKQNILGMTILPPEYLSPIGFLGEENFTINTYSVHHFNASWLTEIQRERNLRKKKFRERFGKKIGSILHLSAISYEEIKYNGIVSFFNQVLAYIKR